MMRKKILGLISLFAIALFSVAIAQGPAASEECCKEKAKTECCKDCKDCKKCKDCKCANTDCKCGCSKSK